MHRERRGGQYACRQRSFDKLTQTSTILDGILRADDFASLASSIPCDIIDTLETNVEAAEQFVQEIQDGKVPTIIQDLPSEIVNSVSEVVNAVVSPPETIWNTGENIVDGVEDVVDSIADGSIVSELPEAIADGWYAVTEGIACFFGGCAEATAGACSSGSLPASAYPSVTPAMYSNTSAATYSYNWPLTSVLAEASTAATSSSAAMGTTVVYPQSTYSAQPPSSQSAQPYVDGAVAGTRVHGLFWAATGMMLVGGLVFWL